MLLYIKLMAQLGGFSEEEQQMNVTSTDLSFLKIWNQQMLSLLCTEIANPTDNRLTVFQWSGSLGVDLTVHQEAYIEALAALLIHKGSDSSSEISEDSQERKRSRIASSFHCFLTEIKRDAELAIPVLASYIEQHLTLLNDNNRCQLLETVETVIKQEWNNCSKMLKIWILKILTLLTKYWIPQSKWTNSTHKLWDIALEAVSETLWSEDQSLANHSWKLMHEIITQRLICADCLKLKIPFLTRRDQKESEINIEASVLTSRAQTYKALLDTGFVTKLDQQWILKWLLQPEKLSNPRLSLESVLAMLQTSPLDQTQKFNIQDWLSQSNTTNCSRLQELLFFVRIQSMDSRNVDWDVNCHWDVNKALDQLDLADVATELLSYFTNENFHTNWKLSCVILLLSPVLDATSIAQFQKNFDALVLKFCADFPSGQWSPVEREKTEILKSFRFLSSRISVYPWITDLLLPIVSAAKIIICKNLYQNSNRKQSLDDFGDVKGHQQLIQGAENEVALEFCFGILDAVLPQLKTPVSNALMHIKEEAKARAFALINQDILHQAFLLKIKIQSTEDDFSFLEEYVKDVQEDPDSLSNFLLEKMVDWTITRGTYDQILTPVEACSWIKHWNSSNNVIQCLDQTLDQLLESFKDLENVLGINLLTKMVLFSRKLKSLQSTKNTNSENEVELIRTVIDLNFPFPCVVLFCTLLDISHEETRDEIDLEQMMKDLLHQYLASSSVRVVEKLILFFSSLALLGRLPEAKVLMMIANACLMHPTWSPCLSKLIEFQASLFGYSSSVQYFKFHKAEFVFEFFVADKSLDNFLSMHNLFGLKKQEFLKTCRKTLIVSFHKKQRNEELEQIATMLNVVSLDEFITQNSQLLKCWTSEPPTNAADFASQLKMQLTRFHSSQTHSSVSQSLDFQTGFSADSVRKFYSQGRSRGYQLNFKNIVEILQSLHSKLVRTEGYRHKVKFIEALLCFCELVKEQICQSFLLQVLFNSVGKQLKSPLLCNSVVCLFQSVITEIKRQDSKLDFNSFPPLKQGVILLTVNLTACLEIYTQDQRRSDRDFLGSFLAKFVDEGWLETQQKSLDVEMMKTITSDFQGLMDSEGLVFSPLPHSILEDTSTVQTTLDWDLKNVVDLFSKIISDMMPEARRRSIRSLSIRLQQTLNSQDQPVGLDKIHCIIKEMYERIQDPDLKQILFLLKGLTPYS
eukprot:g275.t1